jgi:hypothetical protein
LTSKGYLPYKFLLRKVKTLSFVKEILPQNKSDGTFGNYIGVQKSEKILRFLKFEKLRVPPIQISTKKG